MLLSATVGYALDESGLLGTHDDTGSGGLFIAS